MGLKLGRVVAAGEIPLYYNITLRLTLHIELSNLREKTHRKSFFYLTCHGRIEE